MPLPDGDDGGFGSGGNQQGQEMDTVQDGGVSDGLAVQEVMEGPSEMIDASSSAQIVGLVGSPQDLRHLTSDTLGTEVLWPPAAPAFAPFSSAKRFETRRPTVRPDHY